MPVRPQIVTWVQTVATPGTPVTIQPAASSRPTFASLHIQPILSNAAAVYIHNAAGSRGNAWVIPSPLSYGSNALEITFQRIPIEIADLRLDADAASEGVRIAGEPTDP